MNRASHWFTLRLFPFSSCRSSQYEPGRADTIVTLERLRDCIESDSCRPAETTVIMGASPHYGNSQHEKNSGEDIWQVTGLARPSGLAVTVSDIDIVAVSTGRVHQSTLSKNSDIPSSTATSCLKCWTSILPLDIWYLSSSLKLTR